LIGEAFEVSGIRVLAARIDGVDAKALRDTADQLKDRLGTGVVVLGAVDGDKVHLVATITKDLAAKLKAGDLIKPVAELVGGRGGGRPTSPKPAATAPRSSTKRSGSLLESSRAQLDGAPRRPLEPV